MKNLFNAFAAQWHHEAQAEQAFLYLKDWHMK
jgi:hypothetical protein